MSKVIISEVKISEVIMSEGKKHRRTRLAIAIFGQKILIFGQKPSLDFRASDEEIIPARDLSPLNESGPVRL